MPEHEGPTKLHLTHLRQLAEAGGDTIPAFADDPAFVTATLDVIECATEVSKGRPAMLIDALARWYAAAGGDG